MFREFDRLRFDLRGIVSVRLSHCGSASREPCHDNSNDDREFNARVRTVVVELWHIDFQFDLRRCGLSYSARSLLPISVQTVAELM